MLDKALPLTGAAVEAVAAHHLGKPNYERQRRILAASNPVTASRLFPSEALPVSPLEDRLSAEDSSSKRVPLQLLSTPAVNELKSRTSLSSSAAMFHDLATDYRQSVVNLRGPDAPSSRGPAQPFRAASARPSQARGGSSSRAPPSNRTKPRKPAGERNVR